MPNSFERMVSRRVMNGMWFTMGAMTVIIIVKMTKHQGSDVVWGTIVNVLIYFCYVFYRKFDDASRV